MNDFQKEYEKKYAPMWAAMKMILEDEHSKLVELCQRNCWIRRH